MGHKPQVEAGAIFVCRQRGHVVLLCLPDELTMCAHEAAERRVGEDSSVVGLPAEQASDRNERQLLGQQTGPFLEAAGDNNALVWGQDSVAGHHVGLRVGMRTELAGKGEGPEPARDGDRLVAVSVDHLRGKKPGGAAPSARRR